MSYPVDESTAAFDVRKELAKARNGHAPMHGPHEGYAVILEEVEELWAEVKKKKRDFELMKNECIQIAAMAIKFYEDICEKENYR